MGVDVFVGSEAMGTRVLVGVLVGVRLLSMNSDSSANKEQHVAVLPRRNISKNTNPTSAFFFARSTDGNSSTIGFGNVIVLGFEPEATILAQKHRG